MKFKHELKGTFIISKGSESISALPLPHGQNIPWKNIYIKKIIISYLEEKKIGTPSGGLKIIYKYLPNNCTVSPGRLDGAVYQ